jgi:hypothetical protein
LDFSKVITLKAANSHGDYPARLFSIKTVSSGAYIHTFVPPTIEVASIGDVSNFTFSTMSINDLSNISFDASTTSNNQPLTWNSTNQAWEPSTTMSIDTINEKTINNGVVIENVTLKDGSVTVPSDISAHHVYGVNYHVGSKTIVSASAQANFNDLEIKDSINNTTTLLVLGQSGVMELSGTFKTDIIEEKTNNNGVVVEGVTIKNNSITAGSNGTISATNFNIGSRNIVSAAAQANFTDLEVKNSITNDVTLLVMGQSGVMELSGTFKTDIIEEKTANNGVDIENVLLKDGDISANDVSFNNIHVLGDISFNGNLYQNGTLFQSGSGGGGGLTDLSASSINDLSDVSFNSTTTTQGNSLIWNNTDKVWEAGTPTTSIVNTTTTVTNSGGWVNLNATNTPSYDYFGNLAFNDNDTIYFAGGRENSSTASNDVWSYTISTNTWSQVTTLGTFTSRLENGNVYYNNALYAFAGWAGSGSNFNDLNKLDLTQSTPTWSSIGSGSYTARRGHSYTIYGSKLIIFGGYGSSALNDVYEIDLASGNPTWNQLHSGSGTAPTARYESTISVYQNKLVMFGGSTYTNDFWEFDFSTNSWSQVSTSGSTPSGRLGVKGVVVDDKFYIYGGRFSNGSNTNEFYVLDLTTYTWSEITTSITLQAARGHGITVANDKIYVYTNNGSTTGYTYEYTIPTTTTTYNPVEINKLSTYYALSIGPNYDTSNMDNSGNLIVEGNVGIGLSDPSGYKLEVAGDISFNGNLYQNGTLFVGGGGGLTDLSATSISDLSDVSFNSSTTSDGQALIWNSTDGVWEADTPRTTLTQVITTNITPEWSQITASSGTPNANASHAGTIHDDYFYVFAGGNVNNLMYKFHLTTRVWSQVSYSTSGTIPSELYGNLMFSYGNYVYSVFGSRHVSGYPSTNTVLRYDTTNNTLYEVSTSGSTVPTRQAGAIALYNDNGTDYLYYFGGRGSSYYNDMYRLNLSNHNWSSVTTTGGPPDTRYYISHTYTSTKLYIYGGDRSSGDHANDTWEFDLTNNTWTQLQDGTGTAPQGSYGAAIVYNNNNLYIFGGSKTTSGDITDETWKFNLSDNTWTQLSFSTTPGTKYSPAYATDSSNNLYIHGGYNDSYVFQSTIWKLTINDSTSVTTNYIQGLDVNGDISFNGNLYQNGTLFTGSGGVSSGDDISFNNLDISGVLATNKTNNEIKLGAHIIPTTNSTYDLGSAEYKIRHLFLSSNSLWVGDDHKIEISDGKMKFRKLQKNTLPSGLSGIPGASLEDAVAVLGKTPGSNASTFSLADWEAYSIAKGNPLKIDDIFQADDINDDDGLTDTISSSDISFNVVDASGLNVFGTASMQSIIPPITNTYSLGSATHVWKDVYIGPGSLYIDGQKVLESDADTIVVGADANQNLKLNTTGTGVLQIESAAGIQISSTGAGNVELGSTGTGIVRITDNLALNGNVEIFNDSSDMVKINDSLLVTGDISFNGNLYQNGVLFQSGSGGGGGLTDLSATSINDLSDVSFNSTTTSDGATLSWNTNEQLWKPSNVTNSIGVNMITKTYSDISIITIPTGIPGLEIPGLYVDITPTANDSIIELKWNIFCEVYHDSIFRITRNINGTDVLVVPASNIWEGGIALPTFDNNTSTTAQNINFSWYDSPNTTLPITYKVWVGHSGATTTHPLYLNRTTLDIDTNGSRERGVSTVAAIEHPKTKTLVPATSITKQGQVLEILYGRCDGSTVEVESGTYTMPSLPSHRSDGTNNVSTTTYTKDEASEITYTAPPGTDRIEFKFTEYIHWSNIAWIMLYIFCVDDVEISKTETLERGGQYAVGAFNLTATITSNDIDLTQSHKYYFKLKHGETHPFRYGPLEEVDPLWGLQSNDGFIPKLKITAIGESSGQAVTLTNNSVSDLSDISFNSTSTTDGQALVWNSTDGVWEAGAVASSGGLTDLSACSISDLSDVSFNSTTTSDGATLSWNTNEQLWKPSNVTNTIGVNMDFVHYKELKVLSCTGNGYHEIEGLRLTFTPKYNDSVIELKYLIFIQAMQGSTRYTRDMGAIITRTVDGVETIFRNDTGGTDKWDTLSTTTGYDGYDHHAHNISMNYYDEPNTTNEIIYKVKIFRTYDSSDYTLYINRSPYSEGGDAIENALSIGSVIEHPKPKTLVPATSITKQGQVLETLAGVCDGRTVVVESGSYTLPNVTTSLSLTSTYTTVTGSEISYTPPPNTKQVIYIFKTMYSRETTGSHIVTHCRLYIDNVEQTGFRRTYGANGFEGHFGASWTIDIGSVSSTDNVNSRFPNWTTSKTIKIEAREWDNTAQTQLHTTEFWDGTSTDVFSAPQLEIVAIGESSGQSVTLTNNSVSDLSDISFNSTSTTDGQALVWNSTDSVWEAGTVASDSGGGVSSGDDISFNNLDISGVLATNKTNNEIKLGAHIIPTTNSTYDLGSAEYKIRHLYLSNNSLWIGDDHKIDISGGKMRFKKRKKATVPTSIANAGGTDSGALAFAGVAQLADIQLHQWEAYAHTLGGLEAATIADIFQTGLSNDWEEDFEAGASNNSSSSLWTTSSSDIYYDSGNVGIGTTDPGIHTLRVMGTTSAPMYGQVLKVSCNASCWLELEANAGGSVEQWGINCSSGAGDLHFYKRFGTGSAGYKMTLTGNGNLGIGTTSPDSKLHVISTNIFDGIRVEYSDTNPAGVYIGYGGISSIGNTRLRLGAGNTEYMSIATNGNVGIGTTSPDCALHVASFTGIPLPARGYLSSSGETGYAASTNNPQSVSIKSYKNIWSQGAIVVSSDIRIKENIVDVSDNQALEMLRNIPCRYYEYKDKLSKGTDKTIGFIAQEVKEVIPMAVGFGKQIIPNEYRTLTDISWNNTTLYTDLSDCSGIKYRFYVSNDISGNDETMKEVVGNSDNSFTFDQSYNNVFCYGKEVNDFHTLDKQKLFALNFSATQELDRIIQSQQTIIQTHETTIQTHENTIQTHETTIQTHETTIQSQQQEINSLKQEIQTIKQHLGI